MPESYTSPSQLMSSSSPPDVQPPQERQPTVRTRANITSACLACKRRKRKCMGGNPCGHCAGLGVICQYDEKLDKRRKAFNEKARADSEFQRKLLDGVLSTIKGEHSQTIVDMIRADASQEELAEKIEELEQQHDAALGSSRQAHAQSILPLPNRSRQAHDQSLQQYRTSRTPSGTTRALEIGDLLASRQDTPAYSSHPSRMPNSNSPPALSRSSGHVDPRTYPVQAVRPQPPGHDDKHAAINTNADRWPATSARHVPPQSLLQPPRGLPPLPQQVVSNNRSLPRLPPLNVPRTR